MLLVVCCNTNLAAQQKPVLKRDRMIARLPQMKDDSDKAIHIYHIGDEFAYNDYKAATAWYDKALSLSEKLNFTRGIIRYYSSQGEVLNMNGKYADCLAMLMKGLLVSRQRKDNMREGIMCENIGNTFALLEKLDSAIHYYYLALLIFESFNDTIKISIVYNDLSSIYIRTENPEKALAFANKALIILQKNKNEFYLAGLINKESILWKLKRYDEAAAVNRELITEAKLQHDDESVYNALQNQCSHSLQRRQYEQLDKNAQQLSEAANKLNSNEHLAVAGYWLAQASYYKNNFALAKKYVLAAIEKVSADSIARRTKECYRLYAKILLVTDKNILLAAAYEAKADSIEQRTLNENILKTTHDIEARYETEKKDREIKIQKANLSVTRLWLGILSVVIAFIIVLLLVLRRSYRSKQKIAEQEKALHLQQIIQLENERQLTATQAVLKGQEDERSRLAKDLHDGLGGILSSAKYSFNNMKQQFILTEENARAFEKSMAMLDESIAELRRVAHNMMPETLMKLTLNEALQDYCQQVTDSGALPITYQSFGMDELEVNNAVKTTVYRIVQELINNTIKHAQASKALVQLIAKENILNITVEDDGKGFDVKTLSFAPGIGYKNTQSRTAFLKGKLDIQSRHGEGTSVYIEIPL